MNKNNIIIVSLLLVFSMALLVGCTVKNSPLPGTGTGTIPGNPVISSDLSSNLSATQELKKFNSVVELQSFLAQESLNSQSNTLRATGAANGVAQDIAAPMAKSIESGAGAGATDYSQTNVQVAGVDEADFVKNDDRYIYMIANNELIIVDAKDAKNADIISTTKFSENTADYVNYLSAKELFVNKDKLVLFVEGNEKAYYFNKYDITPQQTYRQKTFVLTYDISDRKNPKLLDKSSVSGSYFSSRMIGDFVYLVTQEGVNNYLYVNQPLVMSGVKTIMPDIYYFDNPDQNYQFNTITSFDLKDDSVVDSKTFMLGYSNTLMVSENNIYIAYQKHTNWCWGWMRCGSYDTDQKTRFYSVVVPLLNGEIKSDVDTITSTQLSDDEKWAKITEKLSAFYTKLQNDESLQSQYQPMFDSIQSALDKYDAKKALEDQKTVIQKIGISDGKIDYQSKGEVDGYLLNQYSMDEYNNDLRVATTVNAWVSQGNMNYNNVYVFDSGMNVIGKVENIAENESIYSTRFMGDRLYMVTFQRIDPFFVIDLSSPTSPKVLGELKIPGYSQYLHPYNENFIIGIGKDTGENQWGGISPKGVRATLFDVTDFNNPKEVDHYDIGDVGTDSPVLYDPKAFLFSPTKDIMVLPVSEVTQRNKINPYSYMTSVWNGAYVFNVSEKGFTLLGKVKHSSADTEYYNWWDQASVTRSLYMDDNLYTISQKYIKINDLANNLTSLNTIDLPFDTQGQYYPEPIPMIDASKGVAASGSAGASGSVGVSTPASAPVVIDMPATQ